MTKTAKIVEDTNRIHGASDSVNHPSHYQNIALRHLTDPDQATEKFEVIDLQEGIVDSLGLPPDMSIAIGNAIKYICRAPFKENCAKDLRKAAFECSRAADLAQLHGITVKK